MRLSNVLVCLPLLAAAAAQDQIPLGEKLNSWFDKAKSYIPKAATNPTEAAAAGAASLNVINLTKDNWESVLVPSASAATGSGPEPWMVLLTGGNKTCYGKCAPLEVAWNKTAAIFAADPSAPSLARLHCDEQPVLCHAWLAGPAAVWYIEIPKPAQDQSKSATDIRVIPLNSTTVTTDELVQIHREKTYLKRPLLESRFHPFDGQLAQYRLNIPVAYVLWGMGVVPGWASMLIISFVSRYLVSRQIGNRQARQEGRAP